MQRILFFCCFCLVMLVNVTILYGRQPVIYRYMDVNKKHVVFTCGDRLWIMDRRDGVARVVKTGQTMIENPLFSPDGNSIAYSAVLNGNADVYIISITGGVSRRLTWHPGRDRLRSWNGTRIIYSSAKAAAPARYTELYEIDPTSGRERKLPYTASYCQVASDSTYTAIVSAEDIMETGAFRVYRGGNLCRIQLKNNTTGDIQDLPNGGWNDLNPVWVNRTLYYISDQNRIRNLYSYDLPTGRVSQMTAFDDYDIHSLSTDGRSIAFEKGGQLFLLDLKTRQLQSVLPQLPAGDIFPGKEAYTLSDNRQIRSVCVSPDGTHLAVDYRGDILKAELLKAPVFRNITASAGVHEQKPAWSIDGRLTYLSDASGEYCLIIQGKGPGGNQKIRLGDGYFSELQWSPDGQKIALCDHRRQLLIVDIPSGERSVVAVDSISVLNENPFNCQWSADSKLLAYQERCPNQLTRLVVYNIATGQTAILTDGAIDTRFPVFSPDSKRLYFGVCRDNSLALGELDMSTFSRDRLWDIYQITFSADNKPVRPRKVTANLLNLHNLYVTAEGRLFFIANKDGRSSLMACEAGTGVISVVRPDVNDFQTASVSGQLLCRQGNDFSLLETLPPYHAQEIRIPSLSVVVDPAAEWRNEFYETLRLVRDFFRGSRQADVKILKQRYEPWLGMLTCREDFKYLLRQMLGELQSSHVFFSSPKEPAQVDEAIGLLGADWEIDQEHYRLDKIYHSEIWGAAGPNPLEEDSVNVSEGDYLVSINGKPVPAGAPVEALLQGAAGKRVMLGFSHQLSTADARFYPVIPLYEEEDLRRWQWVSANRFFVDSMSKGRAGYIYLSDTHWPGYQAFNRDFASQANKEFLVVDARFNAGGYFPDYFVEMLARRPLVQFLRNDASPLPEPLMAATPKIMLLVNQRTVSGGELLAAEFRQRGLGLIVGARTAGLSNPFTCDHQLLDGTTVVFPTLELTDLTYHLIIENQGLVPDIIVPGNTEEPTGKTQLLRSLTHLLFNQ